MSSDENGLKIGKVAKLTGISQDRLRVWERRYAAIKPARSESDRRLYSFKDVERLKLMKSLTDKGDSISRIANLDSNALRERLNKSLPPIPVLKPDSQSKSWSEVILIGETLEEKFSQELTHVCALNVVGQYANIESIRTSKDNQTADLVIIEQNTLSPDTFALLEKVSKKTQAQHCFLIYRYATSGLKNQLSTAETTLIRAPINTHNLSRYIQALKTTRQSDVEQIQTNLSIDINLLKNAPVRRYDDKTLAKIAAISPTIDCECPNHLADLLAELTAFETYSDECKSRNAEEAALHAYLNKAAAHARHMIENALTVVLEYEGIEVEVE